MRLIALLGCALLQTFVANAVANDIQVQALDCEFTVPGDYIVQASSDGTEFYRPFRAGYGRISLQSVSDVSAHAESAAKVVETKTAGHLTVTRYTSASGDPRTPDINYTVIRGLSDQLMLTADAVKLAPRIVEACAATVKPQFIEAAKRRIGGCKRIPRERFESFFSETHPQPVFLGGGMRGWRVYEQQGRSVLPSRGLRQGDLVTHFCGATIEEIQSVSGSLCCDDAISDTVKLKLIRNGDATEVVAPIPPGTGAET
jgi:hypothetical protein